MHFLDYVIFEVFSLIKGLGIQSIKTILNTFSSNHACSTYHILCSKNFMHIFSNVTGGASWSPLPHFVSFHSLRPRTSFLGSSRDRLWGHFCYYHANPAKAVEATWSIACAMHKTCPTKASVSRESQFEPFLGL